MQSPVVILAPTFYAARAAAMRRFGANPDELLILADSHSAARGWRRVLLSQNRNGHWLPRITTPQEYFLEAATFDLPDAPQWITRAERRLLLRDLLPQLRRRFKYMARLVRSSDLVRQLDELIFDLREAGEANFALGGDWGEDLRLIVREYGQRLQRVGATDIECAPRLWAEYTSTQSLPVTATLRTVETTASQNLSLFDEPDLTPQCACDLSTCGFVVFDQLLAPSPVQWQAIRVLATQAKMACALVIVPWLESQSDLGWEDAVHLTQGTATERVLRLWREVGAELEVASDATNSERAPAIRGLLKHRTTARPSNVTLTACHTPRDEIERIASDLRGSHQSPQELADCVLVLPCAASYTGILESTLEAHDIPTRVLASRPRVSYPVVARALRLLELQSSEWTLDEIADLFGDGVFRACCADAQGDSEDVLDVSRLRAACIESRFDSLLDLDQCRERLQAAQDASNRRHLLDLEKLERDLGCLRALRELAEKFAAPLSATQWASYARAMLARTTCHLQQINEFWAREAHGQLQWVDEAIERIESFAHRWIEDAPRRVEDFLDWLRLELENGEVGDESAGAALDVGGPRSLICDVPAAVYLAGLTENEWPQNHWVGTLLTRHRHELSTLREHRGDPAQWAQYQLALCVREAHEVHLLHPQWENGREVLRSPLLEDAVLCWGDLPALRPVSLASSRTQRLKSLAQFVLDGNDASVSNIAQALGFSTSEAAHLSTLSAIHRKRQAVDTIGVYDGMLDQNGAAQLQRFFAATGRTLRLDATKLKTYAQCPLKYFFREVLRLRTAGKLSDDFVGRESGTLLHQILERFTREYSGPLNPDNIGEAWFVLSEIARYEIERSTVRPILRAAELRRLLGSNSASGARKPGGILGAFLREELAQTVGESPRPAWSTPLSPHARSGRALPQRLKDSLEAKFTIKVDGHSVEGRFDRIDVASDGSIVAVVDYKTERSVLPDFTRAEAGLDFQLPLYLLAARELFDGDGHDERPALAAAYFHVREAQYIGGVGEPSTLGRRQNKNGPGALSQKRARELETIEFHTWLDETAARVGRIGDLVARGHFNLSLLKREDAGCNWCEYAPICRRDDATISARRAVFARCCDRSRDVYLPIIESPMDEVQTGGAQTSEAGE